MTRTFCILAAMTLAAPAAAQPADPLAPKPPAAQPAAPQPDPALDYDLVRKQVRDCPGEKFVFAWGVGSRPTKVTLCSEEGADRDELVKMIEAAAEKVAKTASIPEDRRKMIVQQMEAKVAELKARPAGPAPKAVAIAPVTIAPKPVSNRPFSAPGLVESPPIVATVPPMPVAPPPASPAAATPAATPRAIPTYAKPRLSLSCITPGEFAAGGPCVTITRDTILIAKANEPLAEAIGFRFVRSGETRGDVVLGAMRKGQERRFTLPREVCSGISSGETQLRVLRGGQSVDTLGPFLLRC